jgi:uncharacterized protein YjiK
MKENRLIFLLIIVPVLISCKSDTSTQAIQSVVGAETTDALNNELSSAYFFPYNLESPSEKFKLPEELIEISGIDFYKKSELLCVQDEVGKLYVYDVKKGELKESVKFGEKGDYEGVAIVRDTIWVLSSDGNLRRIVNFNTQKQETSEFKTPLNESNDTEGLCYDRKNNRLLITCKDKPGAALKGTRAIYGFDLKTNTISEAPVYTIKIEAIKIYLAQTDRLKSISNEMQSLLDPGKGDLSFQPSEAHVHPVTDEIYLISSVGNLMLVLNRDNTIQYITQLNAEVLKQPEGLTFLSDGTMYISDEGRDGRANILKFNYNRNEK